MEETPLEITCQDLKRRIDAGEAVVLVDCREEDEHRIASLPEARLIPMGDVPARVGEITAAGDTPIVVYCHHGMRSARTAEWLRANGAPRAQSLAGGIDAWAVEIDPATPRY